MPAIKHVFTRKQNVVTTSLENPRCPQTRAENYQEASRQRKKYKMKKTCRGLRRAVLLNPVFRVNRTPKFCASSFILRHMDMLKSPWGRDRWRGPPEREENQAPATRSRQRFTGAVRGSEQVKYLERLSGSTAALVIPCQCLRGEDAQALRFWRSTKRGRGPHARTAASVPETFRLPVSSQPLFLTPDNLRGEILPSKSWAGPPGHLTQKSPQTVKGKTEQGRKAVGRERRGSHGGLADFPFSHFPPTRPPNSISGPAVTGRHLPSGVSARTAAAIVVAGVYSRRLLGPAQTEL